MDVRHSNLFGKLPTADWPLDAYNFIRPIGAWKLGVDIDEIDQRLGILASTFFTQPRALTAFTGAGATAQGMRGRAKIVAQRPGDAVSGGRSYCCTASCMIGRERRRAPRAAAGCLLRQSDTRECGYGLLFEMWAQSFHWNHLAAHRQRTKVVNGLWAAAEVGISTKAYLNRRGRLDPWNRRSAARTMRLVVEADSLLAQSTAYVSERRSSRVPPRRPVAERARLVSQRKTDLTRPPTRMDAAAHDSHLVESELPTDYRLKTRSWLLWLWRRARRCR